MLNNNIENKLLKITNEISRCKICKIGKTGKPVPGEGDSEANIMFIGEAPGKKEAETGRPFIGRSGKLLRRLIKELGVSENKVYITSVLKYLPLKGTPSIKDINHGRIHLIKQIKTINPKLIVLLGATACKALLPNRLSINKEHGSYLQKDKINYFITFHPSAALRFPKLIKFIENDFKKLKTLLP